jgi:lysophospholipase
VRPPFQEFVAGDGVRLWVVGRPVTDPRGGILIAPGFGEHVGRYVRLMDDLAARGYSSFVYDPRGHGQSGGPRGHAPSWAALGADLTAVVDALEADGRLPPRRALLGASMGGLLAASWLPAHRGRFHALVLVSPFFAPKLALPPAKVLLARTVGALLPTLAQATGIRGRQLSSDPAVVAAYDGDPHVTRVMSARYFNAMRAAQDALVRGAEGGVLDVPVLLLMGENDPIADVAAARAWMRTATAPGGEVRLYPGLLHEPLNELDRNRVLADLARWLDRRVLQATRPGP